jgi:hypothetical protein
MNYTNSQSDNGNYEYLSTMMQGRKINDVGYLNLNLGYNNSNSVYTSFGDFTKSANQTFYIPEKSFNLNQLSYQGSTELVDAAEIALKGASEQMYELPSPPSNTDVYGRTNVVNVQYTNPGNDPNLQMDRDIRLEISPSLVETNNLENINQQQSTNGIRNNIAINPDSLKGPNYMIYS